MMPIPMPRLPFAVPSTAAVTSLAVLGCFTQVVHTASVQGESARAHQRATGQYLQPGTRQPVRLTTLTARAEAAAVEPPSTRTGSAVVPTAASTPLLLAQWR